MTTLKYTLIDHNLSENCVGTVVNGGHNLQFSNNSCDSNIPVRSPMEQPLGFNGGPTKTMALPANSPAVDAGGSDCPPPYHDQRGVVRPQGPRCDLGAYELIH